MGSRDGIHFCRKAITRLGSLFVNAISTAIRQQTELTSSVLGTEAPNVGPEPGNDIRSDPDPRGLGKLAGEGRGNRQLSIAHLNMRSLNTGFDEMRNLVCDFDFDVLAVSETWLHPDTSSENYKEQV
ncbi:hypothetical protein J6590_078184 [Homalodisca vitripennis]|nr:hypothetical protein J6590_078184 [Homalodisca vitripennis]